MGIRVLEESSEVEKNLGLIRSCFQESVDALVSREEMLKKFQESFKEKLHSIRESLEEGEKLAQKDFQLFLEIGFEEVEAMMEIEEKELETGRKSLDWKLEEMKTTISVVGLKFEEQVAEENEMKARKRELCSILEVIKTKENELKEREMELDLKQEEIVAKENELQSREKSLDSKDREPDLTRKSNRKYSRKRPKSGSGNLQLKLFSDFDVKLHGIRPGQIWASFYDFEIGKIQKVPKFYAVIRGVSESRKEFRVNWLNPVLSSKKVPKKLVDTGLPVDRFVFAKIPEGDLFFPSVGTLSLDMLSHQVYCDRKVVPFLISPVEGDVWGLYKKCGIGRGAYSDSSESTSGNQENLIYEIVEVVEISKHMGIRVAHLDKLVGFRSLFQRRIPDDASEFWISGNELRRFSHRVPSFRMNGDEGLGVPDGSFELDPRALPLMHC